MQLMNLNRLFNLQAEVVTLKTGDTTKAVRA